MTTTGADHVSATHAELTFALAQAAVLAAVEEARRQQMAVAVSVTDPGGHLLAFVRMDGVPHLAVEVTRRKAVTAAGFRAPTKALAVIAENDPVAGADIAKNPDLCLVPGGVPVLAGGRCLGGIGVAGGRSDQDHAVAAAAVAALG